MLGLPASPMSLPAPTLRLGLAFILAGGAFLPAQTVSPAPDRASDKPDDQTVTLSPFVVATNQDTGYIAAGKAEKGQVLTGTMQQEGNFTRSVCSPKGGRRPPGAVWPRSQ